MLLCRMALLKSGKGSCSFLLDTCEARGTLMSGKHGISPAGRVPRLPELDRWHPPRHARFVQPPLNAVPDCMAALERFIHSEGDGIHPIIRAALTHLQFETVPPLLDGNARTGRQKSDNIAVVSSWTNRSTAPPAEHLFQAAVPTSERSEQNE